MTNLTDFRWIRAWGALKNYYLFILRHSFLFLFVLVIINNDNYLWGKVLSRLNVMKTPLSPVPMGLQQAHETGLEVN